MTLALKTRVEESSSDGETISETEDTGGHSGWANCVAQVLNQNKPISKKTLVLSRAKNLSKLKKEKADYEFEIEGEIKEEKPEADKTEQVVKKRKLEKPLQLRVKVTAADIERERSLRKIATKGVVQLFNAVKLQQKKIAEELEEAGTLDHRRDAVLSNIDKKGFLDVLMGGERAKSEYVDNPVKPEKLKDDEDSGENQKGWGVLRDDFMLGKRMQNWDQDSDSEGPGSADELSLSD